MELGEVESVCELADKFEFKPSSLSDVEVWSRDCYLRIWGSMCFCACLGCRSLIWVGGYGRGGGLLGVLIVLLVIGLQ
jgi:hypothetical protein